MASHSPSSKASKKAAAKAKKVAPVVHKKAVVKKVSVKPIKSGASKKAAPAPKGKDHPKSGVKSDAKANAKIDSKALIKKGHDQKDRNKKTEVKKKDAVKPVMKPSMTSPVRPSVVKGPVKPIEKSEKKDLKAPEIKGKKVIATQTVKAKDVVVDAPKNAETSVAEVILTDADGRRYCRTRDCDQAAMVDGYCRYHYLLYWKNIQVRKKILTEGKLSKYIEDLTSRYPDKYLEILRKDLRSEKDFMAAIQELEIDEANVENEFEEENYLDEVRGMSGEASASTGRDDDEF